MNNIQKSCLAETGRWQKLLGVIMVICSVLFALLGAFFIVMGFVTNGAFLEDDGFLGPAMGAMLGGMYILISVLYYFFAIYLLRSGKAFKAYVESEADADLTEGLRNTKSFFFSSSSAAFVLPS